MRYPKPNGWQSFQAPVLCSWSLARPFQTPYLQFFYGVVNLLSFLTLPVYCFRLPSYACCHCVVGTLSLLLSLRLQWRPCTQKSRWYWECKGVPMCVLHTKDYFQESGSKKASQLRYTPESSWSAHQERPQLQRESQGKECEEVSWEHLTCWRSWLTILQGLPVNSFFCCGLLTGPFQPYNAW
jgi:hypothetical protein